MENSCRRCHNSIQASVCFCPACGLPQLVYADDAEPENAEQDRQTGAPRDASMIAWKPALKVCLIFGLPVGLLTSAVSPLHSVSMLLAAFAAVWAVSLYVRLERPAWVTLGAGARLGLVTGLLAAWISFALSGGALFVERYGFHQGAAIDQEWRGRVAMSQQMNQQWMSNVMQADEAQAKAARDQVESFMLSSSGHAGIEAFGYGINALFLIGFATAGGLLGARWSIRRRPVA